MDARSIHQRSEESMKTKRWYLRNRDGKFATCAYKRREDNTFTDEMIIAWTHNPIDTSLLDREQLTHAIWAITKVDHPVHDVITIEAAA